MVFNVPVISLILLLVTFRMLTQRNAWWLRLVFRSTPGSKFVSQTRDKRTNQRVVDHWWTSEHHLVVCGGRWYNQTAKISLKLFAFCFISEDSHFEAAEGWKLKPGMLAHFSVTHLGKVVLKSVFSVTRWRFESQLVSCDLEGEHGRGSSIKIYSPAMQRKRNLPKDYVYCAFDFILILFWFFFTRLHILVEDRRKQPGLAFTPRTYRRSRFMSSWKSCTFLLNSYIKYFS